MNLVVFLHKPCLLVPRHVLENRLDGLAREPWKILSCELEHCCPVGLRKLPQEPAHPGLSKALVALEGSFILLSWGGARQRPSRALEAPEPRARGAGPRC